MRFRCGFVHILKQIQTGTNFKEDGKKEGGRGVVPLSPSFLMVLVRSVEYLGGFSTKDFLPSSNGLTGTQKIIPQTYSLESRIPSGLPSRVV